VAITSNGGVDCPWCAPHFLRFRSHGKAASRLCHVSGLLAITIMDAFMPGVSNRLHVVVGGHRFKKRLRIRFDDIAFLVLPECLFVQVANRRDVTRMLFSNFDHSNPLSSAERPRFAPSAAGAYWTALMVFLPIPRR
jgi:hypothetical protein